MSDAKDILAAAHQLCQATLQRHGPNQPYGSEALNNLMRHREALEEMFEAPVTAEPEETAETESAAEESADQPDPAA